MLIKMIIFTLEIIKFEILLNIYLFSQKKLLNVN